MLNERIVRALLNEGELRGASGVIRLENGLLQYFPAGSESPRLSLPIRYEAKKKTETPARKAAPRRKKAAKPDS